MWPEGKPKKNPEDIEAIINLRKKGYTFREIGEMWNTSKQAVWEVWKRWEKRNLEEARKRY